MSSIQSYDTRYMKLLLLLVKGGTYVFMKHTQMILEEDKTTIDICLKNHRDQLTKEKKRNIPKKLEQSKDIVVLDITAHAYVLLQIFEKRLKAEEIVATKKLREQRNRLIHRGDIPLSEEDFLREWSLLMMVLFQLSTGLSGKDQAYVNELIEDISAIKHPDKATVDLKQVENQDDDVKDMLANQQSIYERRFDDLTRRICELEKSKRNIGSSQSDKKYVFRYIYLVVEVGTDVLRMVFNKIVGPDFKEYLVCNPDRMRVFQKLISRNILTQGQLQQLPPFDNTPSSDKFNINLLTTLLRNVCGLCPSSDPVWSNPHSQDTRLEAYITRFRRYRNDLAHIGSVMEDETVLTAKWDELCLILQRLSSFCGFGNLQAEIDKAKSIAIEP